MFDEIAAANPDRPYMTIPSSKDLSRGFSHLSCGDMARCVDNFARFLELEIPRSSKAKKVAYLGLPDLRNGVVFLAAVEYV